MKRFPLSRRSRSLGLSGILAAVISGVAAGPALAGTTAPDTSGCIAPQLSQPLLSVGDSSWYTLTTGETVDNFDGSGWTLTGGAQIKTAQLADGQTGSVLDLPSGAKAVSPTMCVNSGYQTARTEIRDVVGAEGVQFSVSYAGTSSWNSPQNTGQVHGRGSAWALSGRVTVQPSNTPGWQLARFTLVPGGKASDFQIYNFWVDPRML